MTTPFNKKKLTDWKKRRQQYLIGSVFCVLLALFAFSKRNDLVPRERLVSLGGLTLKEKPSVDREPGKYGHYYLKLVFYEVNKPLKIAGTDYHCADRRVILENFKQGDTLQVWVDKNDFRNNSYFQGENVYGLITGQQNYCNLNCRNKAYNHNQKIGTVAFGSLTLGCLIAGLLPFKPRLKVSKYKTYDIEPLPVILALAFGLIFLAKHFI